MDAEERDTRACEVSEVDARAELDRLLSDPRFHATERARAILRYISEQGFRGHSQGVKAYSIAIDVLGRPSNFDGSLDPIVRIEVGRLRTALGQYYEAYRAPGGIVIDLPKGRYVTVFSVSSSPDCEMGGEVGTEPAGIDERAANGDPVAPSTGRTFPVAGRRAWMAIAVVCFAATAAVWALFEYNVPLTMRPTASVEMTAADPAWSGEADATRSMLLTALTQFRTLTVMGASSTNSTQFSARRAYDTNAYRIEMKYYGDGDDRSVWWQIAKMATGEVLRSGVEREDAAGRSSTAVSMALAASLARRFASSGSVVNEAEIQESASPSLGNVCVLRAERALDDGDAIAISKSADCLERTTANHPGDADAGATLARILLAEKVGAVDQGTLTRSYELASRSVSLAPRSDRAQVALMTAQFAAGWIKAAIDTGNRAMSINPNNPEISAKLAAVLFSAGYFDASVSLARDAQRNVDKAPGDAVVVLALDAYRRSDWSEASLLAEQVHGGDYVIKVLKIAALAQLDSNQAASRLAVMAQHDPEFIRMFHEMMASRRYQPAIAASLEDGLAKAGANLDTTGSLASAR
ncbi:hypothetical protein [Rhizobium sp. GCM10022189]|uniref:hypothetical protein n=1 Tax=Rhizobium sp. GCM10022189 TaxID=3252654 RepID=UPI0036158672